MDPAWPVLQLEPPDLGDGVVVVAGTNAEDGLTAPVGDEKASLHWTRSNIPGILKKETTLSITDTIAMQYCRYEK